MKIEILVTNNELSFLNELISDNLPTLKAGVLSKETKASFYLLSEIESKLLRKALEKKEILKPFKLTLKFYEAYALHQFLLIYIENELTEKRRVTRNILGLINKKLT